MRIAHVSDFSLPRLGGIETHIAALADRQRDAGHHVDLVTAFGGSGGPFARLRPSVIAEAAATVHEGGYDVVHAHAGVFTPIAFGAAAHASRAGIPTVVTGHSLLSRADPGFRVLDLFTRWTRLPVAWTAVSEFAAMPVRRLLGAGTPVTVLPNAIEAGVWRVEPVERDPDQVVIAAVMRLASRKRPMSLVRALRRARAAVPESVRMSAVIVGEGPQLPALERYLGRNGMREWVHLPGSYSHDEIRALYRRADVFVAPARLESFGIAALEARAAGLPVIAMAGAGISTFIGHRHDGLLVADDRAMADAIAELATDAPTRSRIAAHNRAVTPPFGWADALARTHVEYERAAAVQDARPPARIRPARSLTAAEATG